MNPFVIKTSGKFFIVGVNNKLGLVERISVRSLNPAIKSQRYGIAIIKHQITMIAIPKKLSVLSITLFF